MSIAPKHDTESRVSAQKDVSGEQRVEEIMALAATYARELSDAWRDGRGCDEGTATAYAMLRQALVSALGVSPPRPSEAEIAAVIRDWCVEQTRNDTVARRSDPSPEPSTGTDVLFRAERSSLSRFLAESAVLSRQKKEEG